MRRIRLVQLLAVLGLALAVGLVTPAGAQFVSNFIGRTFTSNAPTGVNGFACKVNGCRVDLGTGASDYLQSDGAVVYTPTAFRAIAGLRSSTWLYWDTATNYGTCSAAVEGLAYRQSGTGGTGTLQTTRLCVCVSDGAASPAYTWRNIITGTAGTSTVCNP
jgi:hypothetical protein